MHTNFFKMLYGDDDPQITLEGFVERPDIAAKYNDRRDMPVRLSVETLDSIETTTQINNSDGFATFFLVNPSYSTQRTKKDIKKIVACFADIDHGYVIDNLPLKPTAVIGRDDGESWHVYYQLTEPVYATPENIAAWERAEQHLVTYVYGDQAVKDLPRVLRVPGSSHLKKGEHTYDKIILSPENTYTIDQIKLAFRQPDKLRDAKIKITKCMSKNAPYNDGSGRDVDMYKAGQDLAKSGADERTIESELHNIVDRFFADKSGYDDITKFIRQPANTTDNADYDENLKTLITTEIADFIYCLQDNRYVDTRDPMRTRWDEERFNKFFAYLFDKINIAKFAHKHRLIKTVHEIRYQPAKKPERFIEQGHKKLYNMYMPPEWPDIQTPDSGDAFFEFAERLVPDDTERAFMLESMAAMIQRPEHTLNYALLLYGETKGSGKTLFLSMFERLFGKKIFNRTIENTFRPENENLTEKYNVWMESVHLVHIEEVYQNDKKDFMNKIKSWITSKTITVRRMNTDVYMAQNNANFVASTNYPNALYFDDDDDRRWFVVRCRETRLTDEEKNKYLIPYETDDIDFFAGVYKRLNEMDLTHFNWYDVAPKTEAKNTMAGQSRSELDELIEEAFDDGIFDHKKFWSMNAFKKKLQEWNADRGGRIDFVSRKKTLITKSMRKMGFDKIGDDRIQWRDGEKIHKMVYYYHPNYINEFKDMSISEITKHIKAESQNDDVPFSH